jgi:hypothetical protein
MPSGAKTSATIACSQRSPSTAATTSPSEVYIAFESWKPVPSGATRSAPVAARVLLRGEDRGHGGEVCLGHEARALDQHVVKRDARVVVGIGELEPRQVAARRVVEAHRASIDRAGERGRGERLHARSDREHRVVVAGNACSTTRSPNARR